MLLFAARRLKRQIRFSGGAEHFLNLYMAEAKMLTPNENSAGARTRWNDIRIIGPLLVATMFAAMLLNPGAVAAERSVGSIYRCGPAAICGPCPDGSFPPSVVGGFLLSECPKQSADTTVVPAAAPIKGPIWLGAIQASTTAGQTTLTFPSLLGIFIDDHSVKVTSGGGVVYVGPLPANDKITLPGSGYGTVTVHTSLFTSANYTETVNVS